MQTINAAGAVLSPTLFIQLYKEARKLAPPRFLTLRLNKDRYDELYRHAEVRESIQIGSTPGPLGTSIIRIACIRPPLGVADGIQIKIDPKADPDKLIFEIHGQVELVVENISHDSSS